MKELGVGGVLDQALSLLKNRFGLLLGITMVMLVPYQLLIGFLSLALLPQAPPNPTPAELAQYQSEVFGSPFLLLLAPLSFVWALILLPLTNAAIIFAVASEYLNRPITVGGAVRRVLAIALPYLGTALLVFLAVMGGMFLLIIPGIIFAFWFALWGQVVVIEGLAGVNALKRSKYLMKGSVGKLFVLGLLVGMISGGLGAVCNFIPEQHVQLLVRTILQGILAAFGCAAYVVFYFSCRCKVENFDLTLLADAVAAEAGPVDVSVSNPGLR